MIKFVLSGRFAWVWVWPLLVLPLAAEESWPQFRGPEGNGVSEAEGLPLTWSEDENVGWKTPIHGRGWSSPVVVGNQIWLTTATPNGVRRFAICVNRKTGEVEFDKMLFQVPAPQSIHDFNSYASPTPIIEEDRVYVTFGAAGTACLDTESGEVLWERRDLEVNHFRGAGSSPILYEGLLIMNFDGSDDQYVVALDKETGETVWRTERSIEFDDLNADGEPMAEGDFRKAFSTPHVVEETDHPMLISIGAKAAYAYDPLTGDEYWRLEERDNHSASTRPVYGKGVVYYPTGFSRGKLRAVRPMNGDDPSQPELIWETDRAVPKKPSVLLVDEKVFMINDSGGMVSCLEADSGQLIWQERVGGNYSASPVYAEGRLYFFSESGKTAVIRAADEFEILAENHLDDGFMASPAIAGEAFYLRTKSHLYRIEAGAP